MASGWVEVSSTRSSGGQDPAGGSVDAGRGGRGRGRGRGRYDQDYSGGRGQSDNYAGRGPGVHFLLLCFMLVSLIGTV